MKKILVFGVLALGMLAVSQQQASAWVNWKFGVGLNMGYQSGGNQWLWGAFRNGQPPGSEFFGGPGHHHHGHHAFPYFGGGPAPMGHGHAYGAYPYAPPMGQAYGFGPEYFVPPQPAPVVPPMPAESTVRYSGYHSPYYSGAYYVPVHWYR